MRECPAPNRCTSPPLPMAWAHHWLAVSMGSAWVSRTRCSRLAAASNQVVAAVACISGSCSASIAHVVRRAEPGCHRRAAGLARAELLDDALGLGGADARDAQLH